MIAAVYRNRLKIVPLQAVLIVYAMQKWDLQQQIGATTCADSPVRTIYQTAARADCLAWGGGARAVVKPAAVSYPIAREPQRRFHVFMDSLADTIVTSASFRSSTSGGRRDDSTSTALLR